MSNRLGIVTVLIIFSIVLSITDVAGETPPTPPAKGENASIVYTINQSNQTGNPAPNSTPIDETGKWWDGTIKLSDRSQTRLIVAGIVMILFMQILILVFLIRRTKQHRTFILKR